MKTYEILKQEFVFLLFISLAVLAPADVVLIGNNLPYPSVLDGDFDTVRGGWRAFNQTPHWTSKAVKGGHKLGLAYGMISSGGNPLATYESPVLDHNPAYTKIIRQQCGLVGESDDE